LHCLLPLVLRARERERERERKHEGFIGKPQRARRLRQLRRWSQAPTKASADAAAQSDVLKGARALLQKLLSDFKGSTSRRASARAAATNSSQAPERHQRRPRLGLGTAARAYRVGNFEAKLLNDINGGQGSTEAGTHARMVIETVSRFCCEFSLGWLRRLGAPFQGEFAAKTRDLRNKGGAVGRRSSATCERARSSTRIKIRTTTASKRTKH